MTGKVLNDRWRTADGTSVAEEAVARLVAGRPLDGLGLGSHQGRVDLRGLPAPMPSRLRRFEDRGWFVEVLGQLITFRGAQLEGLDLSGAQLQSFRFFGSKIADCRLEQANCQDWRLWDTQMTDCDFERANLRDAALGTWLEGRRNSWRRIGFTGADFRVAEPLEAVFEECDFSGAKIAGVQFRQCEFTRCRFAGALKDVLLDGRDLPPDRPGPPQMSEVDFSAAMFRDVEFQGYDLENVTLPADPNVRLVRRARCVAQRAIKILDGADSVSARMLLGVLENRLRGPGDDHEADVFNRRDYLDWGGEELARLADDILQRAEADCLT
jgi:uncharacterized protein YjbI with pentapeptide repeats